MSAGLGIVILLAAEGQIRKFYSLSEVSTFDTVDFCLKATSGISFVRHVDGGNPLSIFGNPDLEKINPSFDAETVGRTCKVNLELNEYRESELGDGLAFAVLKSNEEDEENFWKFLLNDSKIYNLDLNYGIGNSDIDLSGTHVAHLKVTTGSADVKVSYNRDIANKTLMDTFQIKVDVGTFIGEKLGRARAANVITEVGFGQALLDFSSDVLEKCDVKATVGAGTLKIILPRDSPVIIHIKESPLCKVTVAKGYEEVENNVYVNKNYDIWAERILTLRVDVALGSVDFVYGD